MPHRCEKSHLSSTVVLLLACVSLAPCLGAQTVLGASQGYVLEASGEPLSGVIVTVRLQRRDSEAARRAVVRIVHALSGVVRQLRHGGLFGDRALPAAVHAKCPVPRFPAL